jgi:putative polyhydroxyalkanoate system protein
VADIYILRNHRLGMVEARKVAYRWAEQAEKGLQMECTYEEGAAHDEVCFSRAGASGTLEVTHNKFELNAKLGFLLGAFKGRIESEIVKNLDELLAAPHAAKSSPAKTAAAKKPAKKS